MVFIAASSEQSVSDRTNTGRFLAASTFANGRWFLGKCIHVCSAWILCALRRPQGVVTSPFEADGVCLLYPGKLFRSLKMKEGRMVSVCGVVSELVVWYGVGGCLR